jgi:hypothetical protein
MALVRSMFRAALGCLAFVSVTVVVAGCSKEPPRPKQLGVVTEFKPVRGATPARAVGEPCEQGPEQCQSGLCLHTRPQPQEGWFCSVPCQPDVTGTADACPYLGFKCVTIHPNPGGRVCVPPGDWYGAVAVHVPAGAGHASRPKP